ncbi:hypothetical protein [Salinarimonas rosea]|uniref:hypothetical protein n=1 Tax=Salinarimonas rosea TaxID=552063 RepID=UPI0012EB6CA3|nr:hypothetical protein [Salinarimonas rosea]
MTLDVLDLDFFLDDIAYNRRHRLEFVSNLFVLPRTPRPETGFPPPGSRSLKEIPAPGLKLRSTPKRANMP